jgi:hypothetical protein
MWRKPEGFNAIIRFLRMRGIHRSLLVIKYIHIAERVGVADDGTYLLTAKPTGTQREQFAIARKEVDDLSAALRKLTETDLKELETLLDKLGAPWTPGRLPAGK